MLSIKIAFLPGQHPQVVARLNPAAERFFGISNATMENGFVDEIKASQSTKEFRPFVSYFMR